MSGSIEAPGVTVGQSVVESGRIGLVGDAGGVSGGGMGGGGGGGVKYGNING